VPVTFTSAFPLVYVSNPKFCAKQDVADVGVGSRDFLTGTLYTGI
jgi:hypothetical protein